MRRFGSWSKPELRANDPIHRCDIRRSESADARPQALFPYSRELVCHGLALLPVELDISSDGQRRATFVVRGTTSTRLNALLEMSLLTMTADCVLLISPPMAGSNAIHHTSPRCGSLVLRFNLIIIIFPGLASTETGEARAAARGWPGRARPRPATTIRANCLSESESPRVKHRGSPWQASGNLLDC